MTFYSGHSCNAYNMRYSRNDIQKEWITFNNGLLHFEKSINPYAGVG